MFQAQQDYAISPCTDCTVRDVNLCSSLLGSSAEDSPAGRRRPSRVHRGAQAGQLIHRSGEPVDGVNVVCDGWAFTFVMLLDGRRQILSFRLPGDIIDAVAIVRERLNFSVQALTNLRYCRFERSELRSIMATRPGLLDEYAAICVGEREETERLVTDLGRRTADERIARLFLALLERLEARGMVDGNSFALPLRQRHIADATGLTPVHVSRVIGAFRHAGLVDIGSRYLKILDLAALRRVGNTR